MMATAAEKGSENRTSLNLPMQLFRRWTDSQVGGRGKARDPSDREDLEMVDLFLRGDVRGFEALFDKYREKVYGIAFRFVRNKEDALEVTQEVFLRVYQGLAKFKTNSKFFTWLYRITVNRAIDFQRSRRAKPLPGMEPQILDTAQERPGVQSIQTSPLQKAQENELREKLAEAVDMLSDKHRAVFVLHAHENLAYKEIADVVGCNIGTVMSRLFYARKKLQQHLADMGFDMPVKII